MTKRRPRETSDSAGDGARSARPAQLTLKAWLLPTPISVGSIALLLRLKEFVAVATETMENLDLMLEHWKLRAVLTDTRLCYADDFPVRHAASDVAFSVLLVTMTNMFPEETASDIGDEQGW